MPLRVRRLWPSFMIRTHTPRSIRDGRSGGTCHPLRQLSRRIACSVQRWVVQFISASVLLAGASAAAAQLTVTWVDNSDNETGFQIERSLDGVSFSQIAVTGANVEYYIDPNAETSTTYWYRVRSYNAAGASAYSNVASGTSSTGASTNTAPTIEDITNQDVSVGGGTGAISFSIWDAETPAGSLSVTGRSSNNSLVPVSNIVFGGSGENRTVAVTPAANRRGVATITVTVSDGVRSRSDTFVVSVDPNSGNPAPLPIVSGPFPGTIVSPGDDIVLTAALEGDTSNLAYVEFFSGGTKIGQVTAPPYSFTWTNVPAGQHRITAVSVNNDGSTSASFLTTISIYGSSRMIGLSTRGVVGATDPMINGFMINGTGPQRVLLRAVGESLESFGVTDAILDPVITVTAFGATEPLVQTSGGWDAEGNSGPLLEAMTVSGAFPLEPGSTDAAILIDLEPGLYTAIASDSSNVGGVCLVEVYFVESPELLSESGQMISLSTRGHVGSGNSALIAGLVVEGATPKQFLVRGVGPGLLPHGVTGVVEDPQIFVIPAGAQDAIASNDEWSADSVAAAAVSSATASVSAFPVSFGSLDAALVIELDPGIYTVLLAPESGPPGVGLIEIYEIAE